MEPGGRITLLIVDDDEDVRDALAAAVAFMGFSSLAVENGALALEVLRSGTLPPPFMVVADLCMPVMDGADLIRAMRGDSRLASIPIVIMTASEPEFSHDLTEWPELTVLRKPFEVEQLTAAVLAAMADDERG